MSCFLVPLAQAIVTSAYCKANKNSLSGENAGPLRRNLPALEKMLWGGSVMLIVDHIINGELTWRYPFFTALGETGGAGVMLHEILTVGLPISAALTLVWAVWALVRFRSKVRV